MDLEAFAKKALEKAQQIVRDGAELTPMLVFECPNGMGFCPMPDYGNNQLKDILRTAMSEIMADQKATRYAFIMEAWMGSPETKTVPEGYLPSKDPNRKEAIAIAAADNQGVRLGITCFIERTEPVTFSEPHMMSTVTGTLFELLQTKPETVH